MGNQLETAEILEATNGRSFFASEQEALPVVAEMADRAALITERLEAEMPGGLRVINGHNYYLREDPFRATPTKLALFRVRDGKFVAYSDPLRPDIVWDNDTMAKATFIDHSILVRDVEAEAKKAARELNPLSVFPGDPQPSLPVRRRLDGRAFELFTTGFSRRYEDLLQKGSGIVLQSGIDSEGGLIDLSDPLHRPEKLVLTLSLDGSDVEARVANWELSVANKYGKSSIWGIKITDGFFYGCLWEYDAQGRQESVLALDDRELEEAMDVIFGLATSDFTAQHAEQLREDIVKARRNAIKFRTKLQSVCIPEKAQRELAKRKKPEVYGFAAIRLLFEFS